MKAIGWLVVTLLLVPCFYTCAQEPGLNTDLCLKYRVRNPAGQNPVKKVLILLHGYGSNESDLLGLGASLPADWAIITPRAPMEVGQGGYMWYTMNKDNGHHSGVKADLDRSRDLVLKFIAEVSTKYHLRASQVYLGGFSQGAMMSYYVGLSHPDAVAGIAPLSGMIIEKLKPELHLDKAKHGLRIFIGHGDMDERIELREDKESEAYLRAGGLTPSFHAYTGMGHSISREEVQDLAAWLPK